MGLNGFELFEDRPRRQAVSLGSGPLLERDLQAIGENLTIAGDFDVAIVAITNGVGATAQSPEVRIDGCLIHLEYPDGDAVLFRNDTRVAMKSWDSAGNISPLFHSGIHSAGGRN